MVSAEIHFNSGERAKMNLKAEKHEDGNYLVVQGGRVYRFDLPAADQLYSFSFSDREKAIEVRAFRPWDTEIVLKCRHAHFGGPFIITSEDGYECRLLREDFRELAHDLWMLFPASERKFNPSLIEGVSFR